MRTSEDLPSIAAVFLVGMVVPIAVTVPIHDVLSLYLSGSQFTALVAVAFGLFAWVFLAVADLDRVNFFFASLVLPWVAVAALLYAAMFVQPDSYGYLFDDPGGLFGYAASYAAAGIAAVAIQRGVERYSRVYDWAPAPRTVAVGLALVAVAAAAAFGGLAHVTASSASVSDVEQGADYPRLDVPTLNATVEGEPSELRLAVTAPDESTITRRIPRSDMRDGGTTVPIRFEEFGSPEPRPGTYRVTVTSLPGVTVDTATYTVENEPSPAILPVETDASGEAPESDLPFGSESP